jgi:hypothetical protein
MVTIQASSSAVMFTTAARHQSFSLHAKAVRSAGGRYQWTTARDGRCSRAGYLKGQPRVIVATHPGLRVGGFTVVVGHLNSTGTLPAAAAAAARACTASIAFRALTILAWMVTLPTPKPVAWPQLGRCSSAHNPHETTWQRRHRRVPDPHLASGLRLRHWAFRPSCRR